VTIPGLAADLSVRLDAYERDNKEMREDLVELKEKVRKLAYPPQTVSVQNMASHSQTIALQHIDRLLGIWDGTAFHKEWVTQGMQGVRSALDVDIQHYVRIEAFAQDMRVHLERAREVGLFIPSAEELIPPMGWEIEIKRAPSDSGNVSPVVPAVRDVSVVAAATPVVAPPNPPPVAVTTTPVSIAPVPQVVGNSPVAPPLHVTPLTPSDVMPPTPPNLAPTPPVEGAAFAPPPPVLSPAPPADSSQTPPRENPSFFPPASEGECTLPPVLKRSHPDTAKDAGSSKRQRK